MLAPLAGSAGPAGQPPGPRRRRRQPRIQDAAPSPCPFTGGNAVSVAVAHSLDLATAYPDGGSMYPGLCNSLTGLGNRYPQRLPPGTDPGIWQGMCPGTQAGTSPVTGLGTSP